MRQQAGSNLQRPLSSGAIIVCYYDNSPVIEAPIVLVAPRFRAPRICRCNKAVFSESVSILLTFSDEHNGRLQEFR
jgi:hypothetical protein